VAFSCESILACTAHTSERELERDRARVRERERERVRERGIGRANEREGEREQARERERQRERECRCGGGNKGGLFLREHLSLHCTHQRERGREGEGRREREREGGGGKEREGERASERERERERGSERGRARERERADKDTLGSRGCEDSPGVQGYLSHQTPPPPYDPTRAQGTAGSYAGECFL